MTPTPSVRARVPSVSARADRIGPLLGLWLLAALALLLGAGAARADQGSTIIERCTHGQSLSGFSQQAYQKALQEIPTEVEEYSPCADEIRKAQLAAAGGRGGGAGAGGGEGSSAASALASATPTERAAINHAHSAGSTPVQVGGQPIVPGVVHADVASAVSTLPAPLLAVLALMLAAALAIGGGALRNRVRARRHD